MIEYTYILAWMGVVLVQAAVHYTLSARRRLDSTETEFKESGGERAHQRTILTMQAPFPVRMDEEEEDSEDLDEDELQQLLSQTGKEMMRVSYRVSRFTVARIGSILTTSGEQSSRSLQAIVQEQLSCTQ